MSTFDPSDTIAAISSPPGFGFRGIVRLSGPKALSVAMAGFTADVVATPPIRPARLRGSYRLDGLRPPLPASLIVWPGPRTYTGQESAEIHTVGSTPLVQHLLAHCLTRGARLAGPGEFTLRAFLSGRIDLTRAEAVLGVIDARSPAQLDAALGQLAGGLATPIAALRDRLLDVLAHIEANLDFVDEPDVDPLGRIELAAELVSGSAEVAALADRLRGRDRPEGHPRVVLVGPPNAGKSRLFNALLGGAPRALVSPRPGTTRDYLSALLVVDSLTVDLFDTAGEDLAPSSSIETAAQAHRVLESARADLLLDCAPANSELSWLDNDDRPRLRILTKTDLADVLPDPLPGVIFTSAATGAGLDALRRAIAANVRAEESSADLPTATGARCREGLTLASSSLASAALALTQGAGDELVSIDLRQAIDELGKVVGAVVNDDVLERIFQRFCIGK